ncbi:hypothetical protein ASG11_07975 [Sphingomonas sp. Leaf357]|uniref:CAP domain-containing protein n=1 Tax=Sphingomonas sp. Leaf357 TaxID=1736350 RepID=UPI0006F35C1B|nr:CAP domain-containing protein [Sphingomonas sp. Leaf357]KQS04196.1 hypothetical protein ASG11_07975 [Sphingomonas sp. Leaf357]
MLGRLLGFLVLAGTASAGAGQTVEWRRTMAPAPRGDALLRFTMLSEHNDARSAVGLEPLSWDDRLAASAAAYAGSLARDNRFEHARQADGPDRQGENLWMGTRDAYTFREMIDGWTDEHRFYRPVPVPYSSSTGRWSDVAHYTQIVWHDTTALGCAIASNRANDFLVCRYAAPGNVMGEVPFE